MKALLAWLRRLFRKPPPTRQPNHPGMDPLAPHALDHGAYADGVPKPERLLQLEAEDPFWITFGGSVEDPFGCGGETFRQRALFKAKQQENAP